MNALDSSYLPSGALQTTTPGAAGGGAGESPLLAMLLPMIQQSMSRKERMAALAEEEAKKQVIDRNNARAAAVKDGQKVPINRPDNSGLVHGGSRGGGEASPVDALANQRASMAGEQMMIDRLPAPIKYIGGPGIIAGATTDPMAMNAATRRSFLPAGSTEGASDSQRNKDREGVQAEQAAGRKERTDARGDMDFYGQQARKMSTERRLGLGGY